MKKSSARPRLSILLFTLSVCASAFAQTLVFQGRVVSVANGDTVTVLTQSNTEFQVRCHGINAPAGQENFASQARERLTDVLLDQSVTVRDVQRDPNGTIVGTIMSNGRDVCLELVRAGLALHDTESDQRRSARQQYALAQSNARNNGFGMWRSAQSAETATPVVTSADTTDAFLPDASANARGYFRKNGTYVAGNQRNINSFNGRAETKRQSKWITALKWIGIGAALGAMMYVEARYPSGTAVTTPMARCNDGTISYSQNRRGTCSHHRGVAVWFR
jgi:endonuclease YncB( thermonuclease family)